jgi:hypothetical protein
MYYILKLNNVYKVSKFPWLNIDPLPVSIINPLPVSIIDPYQFIYF